MVGVVCVVSRYSTYCGEKKKGISENCAKGKTQSNMYRKKGTRNDEQRY